jgi:hypothetical protein
MSQKGHSLRQSRTQRSHKLAYLLDVGEASRRSLCPSCPSMM